MKSTRWTTPWSRHCWARATIGRGRSLAHSHAALAYAGTLLAAGLAAFVFLAHDGGPELLRLRRRLRIAAVVGATGVLVALPIQAALATGLGAGAIAQDGVLGQVLGDDVGLSAATVLVGLAVLVLDAARRRVVSLAGAVVATAGFAIAGHTATTEPRWLVTAADVAHLAAAAVWLGGLVALASVLRARRDDAAATAAPVVARFSAIAAIALGGVAIGGAAQGWYQVRAVDALTSTTYGKTLMAKLAVVAAVVALGAWNRYRLVPALAAAPERAARVLRRTVRLESVGLLLAVVLTAALVNVTPARTAAGIGSIFAETLALGDGTVQLVVDPGRRGFNQVHLYVFDETGQVADPFEEVVLRLSLPAAELGPLERKPFVAGPGHYQLNGPDLSIAGTWTIQIVGRVDRFDQYTATFRVPVRP